MRWHNLFTAADAAATQAELQKILVSAGYTPYDPFGLIPGRAYPQTVKTFIAPPQGIWTRVIVAPDAAPDESVLLALPSLCLSLALDGDQASIEVYQQGKKADMIPALTPYLRATATPADLQAALTKTGSATTSTSSPFDALSGEIGSMKSKVNLKHAERMFSRMTGKLLKGEQANAAKTLLEQKQPQWNSTGGVRIAALLDCLGITAWREPDFVALRDSYQLHNRRQRNPNATLYPGDAGVMDAVPDALRFSPLFVGKM